MSYANIMRKKLKLNNVLKSAFPEMDLDVRGDLVEAISDLAEAMADERSDQNFWSE